MKGKRATHCKVCGRPFTEVERYFNRAMCRPCNREVTRQRSRDRAALYRSVFPGKDRRLGEPTVRLTGRALLERKLRVQRYADCIAEGKAIDYVPRDGRDLK